MQAARSTNDKVPSDFSADVKSMVSKLVEIIQATQRLVSATASPLDDKDLAIPDENFVMVDDLPKRNTPHDVLLECQFLLNDALRRLLEETSVPGSEKSSRHR